MGRLDGKVAIITGTTSGIGRTTAIRFAKEGARIVGAGRRANRGEEMVKMIRKAGGEAIFVTTDVSQSPDVIRMVKKAIDTYGRIDILFNNAGVQEQFVPLHELDEAEFDRVIAINLKGTFLCMKYVIPEMLKTGGGSIINVGSTVNVMGIPGVPAYSASKGGVATLSMETAVDYVRQNIRVNWTMPGLIATEMIADKAFKGDKELIEKVGANMVLGRYGTEEEIANLVLFLASDESSYITATGIRIDGAGTQGNKFINI
jgi:NAD(P)-dependent dehydrogenase (short-subunit alcohol dehydrogenase family)